MTQEGLLLFLACIATAGLKVQIVFLNPKHKQEKEHQNDMSFLLSLPIVLCVCVCTVNAVLQHLNK